MTDISKIIPILRREYADAKIALDFGDTWQLLVAVILSAQCTDERVNKVTPALFKALPHVEDFAEVEQKKLEKLIFSTGFYKNKSKNIRSAAQMIVSEFGGEVPNNMESLLLLPGVARKTANVVLWSGFGICDGIVVDTHVCRIAGKLGLVSDKLAKAKSAVKIEQELMKIVPPEDWGGFSHWLIFHGRRVCVARKPRCKDCALNKICPSADLNY